jgi:hypothetical protein
MNKHIIQASGSAPYLHAMRCVTRMRDGDSGTPPYDELERRLRWGGLEMSRVGVASGTVRRGGETFAINGTSCSHCDWTSESSIASSENHLTAARLTID